MFHNSVFLINSQGCLSGVPVQGGIYTILSLCKRFVGSYAGKGFSTMCCKSKKN